MMTTAIHTTTETGRVPSELKEQIVRQSMRFLAKFRGGKDDSTITLKAAFATSRVENELLLEILRAFEQYSQRSGESTTIDFRIDYNAQEQKLTAKQRRALEYVEQWRKGDADKQTVALEYFMRDLEEERHGDR